jgi:protein-S-isoprenylcysteine O-methyltransferase Ste14
MRFNVENIISLIGFLFKRLWPFFTLVTSVWAIFFPNHAAKTWFGLETPYAAGTLYLWSHYGITIAGQLLIVFANPSLAKERGNTGAKDIASWDHYLVPFMSLGGLLIWAVAVADVARNGSQRFPPASLFATPVARHNFNVFISSMIFLSMSFFNVAMLQNNYFSSLVRLQTDRGHKVCDTGLYTIVRHPGYTSWLINILAPLALNSLWSIGPSLLLVAVIVVRATWEDATLQKCLPGYKQFAQKTKWKLIPYVY